METMIAMQRQSVVVLAAWCSVAFLTCSWARATLPKSCDTKILVFSGEIGIIQRSFFFEHIRSLSSGS